MTPLPTKAERYLDELGRLLAPAEPVDRLEILAGVREHLESAFADLGETPSDAAVDAALAQLGSPDSVARQAVADASVAPPSAGASHQRVPLLSRGWVVPTVVVLLALALTVDSLVLGGFSMWRQESTAATGESGPSLGPMLPNGSIASTALGLLVAVALAAFPAWAPAVVLLWASPRWSTRWRLAGTFLPLVAPVTTLLAAVLWPPAGLVGLIVGGAASVATLVLLARAGH